MVKANRTTNLLIPFYSSFGHEFVQAYNTVSDRYKNVLLFLGDSLYSESFKDYDKFLTEDVIFVVFLQKVFNFDRYQLLFQSHQNYITNYVSPEGHEVFIFRLNEPYIKAARELKRSNYSKMYDMRTIDNYFGATKDWYLKYVDSQGTVTFHVIENNKELTYREMKAKWEGIGATNFFKNLVISPYHMFNRSEKLRDLLEIIYGATIPKENELIEKIKLEQEILNYEPITISA